MLLAIDIGNTTTEIAVFLESKLRDSWRLSTKVTRTPDETWIVLSQLLSSISIPSHEISKIAISSVVPNLTRIYAQVCEERYKLKPLIITHTLVSELKINYLPPTAVGADRLCGGVAAYKKYGGPVIIIDMGTATVFDVISQDGEYIGGLIAPGLLTAVDSLHQATAQLPKVELVFPSKVIGSDTVSSIQSGVLYGALAMIDGIVGKIKQEITKDCKVVATGGFSNLIKPFSKTIDFIDNHLVLEGIELIASKL